MEITSKMMAIYIGGQMEIQNVQEKYIFCGEIADIIVKKNELQVKFKWLAKGDGYPPLPEKWTKADNLNYAASLEIYSPVDIGEERLCLSCSITGEVVVFYRLGGSKLDVNKVEGLVI